MNTNGIHHLGLVVTDLEKAISFYSEVLGFEIVKKGGWEAPNEVFDGLVGLQGTSAEICLMKTGNCYLEIFSYESTRTQTPPTSEADHLGIRHIGVEVEDIEPVLDLLIKHNGQQIGSMVNVKGGGSAVYCRDPFGNIVELIKTAGSMPAIKELGQTD